MNINFVAVLTATVAQFIFGAIWYMPIFGKIWGKIHGFDKLSEQEQKTMTKKMGPYLVAQFAFTLLTTVVLAMLTTKFLDSSIYELALYIWIGFIVPTQAAAVIFGGTQPKWMLTKILIMSFAALGNIYIASYIIQAF